MNSRTKHTHLAGLMLALTVLIAGCSSTPTVRYDLNSLDPLTTTPTDGALLNYRLAEVTVPEPINTTALMVRQPDNSLMLLSHDQWVASLQEVVQTAMADTLTDSIGTPPTPQSMQARGVNHIEVALDIRQFEMRPGQFASISALWQINFGGHKNASITCFTNTRMTVKPGVAALVAAQQRNLQILGQQIATAMQTTAAPRDSRCHG